MTTSPQHLTIHPLWPQVVNIQVDFRSPQQPVVVHKTDIRRACSLHMVKLSISIQESFYQAKNPSAPTLHLPQHTQHNQTLFTEAYNNPPPSTGILSQSYTIHPTLFHTQSCTHHHLRGVESHSLKITKAKLGLHFKCIRAHTHPIILQSTNLPM